MGSTQIEAAVKLAPAFISDPEVVKSTEERLRYFTTLKSRNLESKCLVHQIGGIETKQIGVRTCFINTKIWIMEESSIFEDFMTFRISDLIIRDQVSSFCKEMESELYSEVGNSEHTIIKHREEVRKQNKYSRIVESRSREMERRRVLVEMNFRESIKKMLKLGFTIDDVNKQVAEIAMEAVHDS